MTWKTSQGSTIADGDFLVGTIDSALVAMGAWRRLSTTRGELKRMRVEPALQGRGFGRQMLAALEASALTGGISELELETTKVQVAAQRLYEAAGFRRSSEGHAHGYETVRYLKALQAG